MIPFEPMQLNFKKADPMWVRVTGASGYLGGWAIREMERRGHNVYSWDFPGARTVVHLGWLAKPGDGQAVLQQRCVDDTSRLVDWCIQRGVRLVFASTASVYGLRGEDEPPCREDANLFPNCDYTRAKAAAEGLVGRMGELGCVLRLGSLMGVGVEGGRTRTDLVVNAFASAAAEGSVIEVWNPSSWKPVVHVRDAAEVIARAVEERWTGVVNVASVNMRARDIAWKVSVRHTSTIVWKNDSPNGNRSCRVDCSELRRRMPDYQWRTVEDAVAEFVGQDTKVSSSMARVMAT